MDTSYLCLVSILNNSSSSKLSEACWFWFQISMVCMKIWSPCIFRNGTTYCPLLSEQTETEFKSKSQKFSSEYQACFAFTSSAMCPVVAATLVFYRVEPWERNSLEKWSIEIAVSCWFYPNNPHCHPSADKPWGLYLWFQPADRWSA